MPRRASHRNVAIDEAAAPQAMPAVPTDASLLSPEIRTLRTHWKWAAFSQFFYTFSPLLHMDDISLNDIEDDLASGNSIYLPRIMQRLLYTLSYDRKVSPTNWQTTLRKQYYKRDPAANPIGPDPDDTTLASSRRATSFATPDPHSRAKTAESDAAEPATGATHAANETDASENADVKHESSISPKVEETDSIEDTGPVEQTKDWLHLSMLEKLDSLYLLMEWQFQNVTRLRTLMKSDDENASWRVEPVGYDAKLNSYWLIGERLWIQRSPPKRQGGPKSLKRKKPPRKSNSKKALKSAKRTRVEKLAAPTKASHKGRAVSTPDVQQTPSSRHSRAAKAQANIKLDAQAKELEELNRQALALAREDAGLRSSTRRSSFSPSKNATSRSVGTRASSRLRATSNDEDHADEWEGDGDSDPRATKRRFDSESSSISELTELSDTLSDHSEEAGQEDSEPEEEPQESEPEAKEEEPQSLPADFVEWETVCVSLYDWEHIADRFENATHYTEKAFYKMLTKNIVPVITEELREQERRKMKKVVEHEVVTLRKRSSRIALKESAKEEAEKQKFEHEGRHTRSQRAEARQQKEESSRAQREAAREERRREQEEREAREAEKATIAEEEKNMVVDIVSNGRSSTRASGRSSRARQSAGKAHSSSHTKTSKTGSRTPVDGDWEVDCEVCRRSGTNIDGEQQLVSCNSCGRWQHIQCHDAADRANGLSIRNWKTVDFFCRKCLRTNTRPTNGAYHVPPVGRQSSYLATSSYAPGTTAYAQYPAAHQADPYVDHSAQPRTYYQQHSDVRTNGHERYAQTPQQTTRPISFTHYQPQQRGFSQQYPGHTQSYGQLASSSAALGQYGQSYQDAPVNMSGYPEHAQRPVHNGRQEYAAPPPPPPPRDDRLYRDPWPQTQRTPDGYATSYRQSSL